MVLFKNIKLNLFLIANMLVLTLSCQPNMKTVKDTNQKVITGAENTGAYLPFLIKKKVALLVNHTSIIGKTHLLDTLRASGINVTKVFAPEHGFRGDVSDGVEIDHSIDAKTGIPIISLYGKNKKPTSEQLKNLDIVIYDIQDVGARFYTYMSAMNYIMEACAENDIELIILDRPNPNGHYIDGPVLDLKFKSYVGMHPIPIVYGMTNGEMAQMIVGENWLKKSSTLNMRIIPLKNWNHKTKYSLPIKPSPNLPNDQAIALYPSLCLFEGTNISVGRGTYDAFQIIGAPDSIFGNYEFIPKSIPNMSKYPPYENDLCFGLDLRNHKSEAKLNLNLLINFYNRSNEKNIFFNDYFKKLAGNELLQKQIEQGLSAGDIKLTWQKELELFKAKRKQYLLYEDFY
jgi:uncharacterized protein YbbC (DUF1343 family)